MKSFETGKITVKGQVIIPVKVRDLLNVKDGNRLQFTQEGVYIRLNLNNNLHTYNKIFSTKKPMLRIDSH